MPDSLMWFGRTAREEGGAGNSVQREWEKARQEKETKTNKEGRSKTEEGEEEERG